MRKIWSKWQARVLLVLLTQAARSPAASGALTRQGSTTPDYHNQVHQSTHLALENQPRAVLTEGNTRALLQAEQQQQLDLQGSSTAYKDDSNQIASEAVIIADTALRTDTALQTQTKTEVLLAQRHEPQSAVQEYQSSNAAVLDEARLISAAASQASHSLADTVEKTAGEDQFDAWPLVDPPLQDALYECFGSSKLHRVCKYYNLLLWNGTLYYPTTDLAVLETGPPRVPISWVSLSPFDKMEFGQDEWAEVVLPQDLPFKWDTTPKLSMKEALFWKLTFQDNYGHLLGEHGPIIHNLMCSYLNRCSYTEEDLKDFHILLGNVREEEISMMPAASQEMFNCFCKRALMLSSDIFFKDHVVVVGTLLAGIGPTCRGYPWCRPQFGRSPMVGNMVTTWQERMLDCTGLPKNVIAPADTINLVVIDRHYSAGRSFLNLPDVISHLQVKFPVTLNITVDKLEGKSLQQQAALYYNASIVIQTHGAALGNVIFLPRGAVVIDIVPENNEDKSPWVVYMCADFKPLFISPITIPPQKTVLQMAKVRRTKEWAMLSPYWRQRILREGVCPEDEDVDWQMDTYATCNFQWFLKSGNLVLDYGQVGDAVETGIMHVRGVHERMIDYVHKSYEFDLTAAVV